MKKVICDNCEDYKKEAARFKICIGKSPDPSGNGYEYDWKYIDLCLQCAVLKFTGTIKNWED